MRRNGSEPSTARSPLRFRLVLSAWGLLWAVGGTVAFVLLGQTGWAVACGVLAVLALVDMAVVVVRMRQGAHFQPGRDIPPYEPQERPRRPGGR